MKTNLIVLDVETGGKKSVENPITEVALHIVDPVTFKIIDKYQTYVKPYNNLIITKEAIDATQVNMKDVNNGIDVKTLVTMLIIQFKKAKNNAKYDLPQIVLHNAPFDIRFLQYAFEFCKKNLFDYIDLVPICTMRLIKLHDAGSKNGKAETSSISLTASCERFKIKLKSAHGAENDVIATTALLKALTSKLRQIENSSTNKEEKAEPEVKSRKHFQF